MSVRKLHIFTWIGVALLLLVLGFLLRNRFWGEASDITLSSQATESVDEIRLMFCDTCFLQLKKNADGQWQGLSGNDSFEADAAQVNDFLSVFNTWEILSIPADSQAGEWKREMAFRGGELLLKSGKHKLLQASFMPCNEGLVLRQRSHPLCWVGMPYRSGEWLHFFRPEAGQWHNRLLIHFNYTELISVCVDYSESEASYCLKRNDGGYLLKHGAASDTVPVAVAQAYLSAFSRVYFDFRNPKSGVGRFLYDLEVCTSSGSCPAFRVFEKTTDGDPDIFKAMVTVERPAGVDTVEIPYVVLDKLAKTPDWFRSRLR